MKDRSDRRQLVALAKRLVEMALDSGDSVVSIDRVKSRDNAANPTSPTFKLISPITLPLKCLCEAATH
jgi:hypothetical protein